MSTTELIPSKNATLEELNKKLALLKGRAEALRVVDQPTYIEAAQLKLEIQAYQKAVKFQTRPEIEILTEKLRKAQAEEKMLLFPADQMLAMAESKRKAWMEEERRKAEEEQRRINEARNREARKNHEKLPPQVEVKAAIPTVPGVRNQQYFKFEVTDASKVKRDWLTLDLVAIGQKVRADKDPELSMREIGGIRAWKE